nr:uncharacterized protein LOC127328811 [Lolium perenne]
MTESIRIAGFIDINREETNLCAEHLVRVFLARRVLPLQRRAHKISEMSGPMDPTRITTHRLSRTDLVLKAKQICQNPLSSSGGYGLAPYSRRNSPPRRNFRRIGQEHPASYTPDRIFQDDLDANPYVRGRQQMGRTHTPHPGSEGRKNKAPATEAGSSHAPPAKRSRQEVVGGRKVTAKHHRKMPVASGPTLKITKSASGMKPESSEDSPMASPPPQPSLVPYGAGKPSASPLGGSTSTGRAAPKPPQHRSEGKPVSPPRTQDTGASNIGAGAEDAGQGEPLVPPIPKKKKKKNTASSPSKAAPDSSGPASSSLAKEAPGASARSKTPTPPPAASTGGPAPAPSSLVLHTSRTSVVAGESLGRITELTRGGVELGYLADYAHKWNQADLPPATCGLGKDRLPVADPAGPRSTAQHFGRLQRAIKEFDTAWHDANNNVVAQLRAVESRHSQELEKVRAAAEVKLNESLEEFTNSTAVLRAELEERTKAQEDQSKARELAENQVAALMTEQKDYDRLVVQTDTLLLRIFPDSQEYAVRKVEERRTELSFRDRELPWDAYDHLVALSSRVQHMRAVDWHLVDLPDHAKEICKVLWPEEAVPESVTLISDHLDLDAFHAVRDEAPTDMDPALTAKRQDRAYRIAEFAPFRTFIPPPPEVKDALSDDEEDIEEEEEEEAGEGAAPPEAPEAGAQLPVS